MRMSAASPPPPLCESDRDETTEASSSFTEGVGGAAALQKLMKH